LRVHADLVNDETYLQALRARAMVMIHRVTEASDVFASAMSKTENLAEFLQVRNQILEAIRYRTTAELNYGAIADLLDRAFGGNRPTWVELGVADLEFRANDFEAALGRLEPLESKVAAQPANERFFYYKTYSSALHMAEQYEKAAEAYRQLLELSPDNALAMNNLAYVLTENLDQPEEAVEMAQRAIELQPDNALVLDTLGWALFKTGRNDGARAALENSVKQQRSASNCMHLAEVLLKLELRPEAIEMLESARRLAEQSNDSQTAQTITNRLEEVGQ
jgi:tetratricopeptide (TPR) repeat protein